MTTTATQVDTGTLLARLDALQARLDAAYDRRQAAWRQLGTVDSDTEYSVLLGIVNARQEECDDIQASMMRIIRQLQARGAQ